MLDCVSKSSSNLHGAYKLYIYLGKVGSESRECPKLTKDVQKSTLLKSFLHLPWAALP